MSQSETIQSAEALPQAHGESLPVFDSSLKYNGMYKSVKEYEDARKAYSVFPNTILPSEENAFPLAAESDVSRLRGETVLESEASLPTTNNELVTSPSAIEGEVDDNIIDVEAREIFVDLESPDDTTDIAELIEAHDEMTVGTEKLVFTPQLKALARGVLSTLDHLLADHEAELPVEMDWRPYIMSEPEYDESYDYVLLQRLLAAQYRRKRAARRMEDALRTIYSSSSLPSTSESSLPNPVAPVEGPPDNEAAATPTEPEPILKIEHDTASVVETPALEYAGTPPALEYTGTPPALTYEPTPGPSGNQGQGQGQAPQITQQ